ncbi:MAG: hypothetical protein E6J34_20125 [Chloroflexi bacterium]|nr:MAG: hypothetical protein E6J34_20125 [Chloroflexota bacterium]
MPPTPDTSPTPSANQTDTSILLFPPIVHVLFGIVLVIVFLVGCIMSMQTSESWIRSLQQASLAPDIAIFGQFPLFFTGKMDEDTSIAFVFAFTVQCVLLVTKIGLASVHARVAKKLGNVTPTALMQKSAKRRMSVWGWLSNIALALNAIADIVYAWHLGFWQAMAFSAVMFIATFYLGTFGIQNISAGMTGMNN